MQHCSHLRLTALPRCHAGVTPSPWHGELNGAAHVASPFGGGGELNDAPPISPFDASPIRGHNSINNNTNTNFPFGGAHLHGELNGPPPASPFGGNVLGARELNGPPPASPFGGGELNGPPPASPFGGGELTGPPPASPFGGGSTQGTAEITCALASLACTQPDEQRLTCLGEW